MNDINLDDLNLFAKFVKSTEFDYKNYYYIPYFISSPCYIRKINRKNEAFLPLYILLLNKNDFKKYSIKKTHINWKSIHYYQTYTYLTDNGQSAKLLEQLPIFKNYFRDEYITVNPENIKIKKLKDLIKEGFYKDLHSIINNKLKNEVFIEFNFEKRRYLISGVELVRFFYAKAQKDSLLNVLLHPEGLSLLYRDITTSISEFYLRLKNPCAKVDGDNP